METQEIDLSLKVDEDAGEENIFGFGGGLDLFEIVANETSRSSGGACANDCEPPIENEEDDTEEGAEENTEGMNAKDWRESRVANDLTVQLHAALEEAKHHHRYLLIWNISKHPNVKSLIYTALAFGFAPVLVGMPGMIKKLRVKQSLYLYFPTVPEVVAYLESNNVKILAIEITDKSQNIHDNNLFRPSHVAFMLGNEGDGLNSTQRKHATGYLYVPQCGSGTASLNVSVAGSIVMDTYREWLRNQSLS